MVWNGPSVDWARITGSHMQPSRSLISTASPSPMVVDQETRSHSKRTSSRHRACWPFSDWVALPLDADATDFISERAESRTADSGNSRPPVVFRPEALLLFVDDFSLQSHRMRNASDVQEIIARPPHAEAHQEGVSRCAFQGLGIPWHDHA